MAEINFKTQQEEPQIKEIQFESILNKDGFYIFHTLKGTEPATSGNYSIIFTAIRAFSVLHISEVHGTAGTDGGAVTLNIERLSGTTAKGSGDEICVTGFDIKGTADTVQDKKTISIQNTLIKVGDRLALKLTGTPTSIADLNVTIYLKPFGKGSYL